MIKPLVKNVLVAINGSQSSIHAAMYGIIMAKQYHFNLKFVYVVDTATLKRLTIGKFLVQEESADFESNLHADGEKYLNYVTELAKKKGVKAEAELREGSVWVEVVKAADAFGAKLILLGGHPSRYSVTGKVSDESAIFSRTDKEIILNANCSTLVVYEPKIEELYRIL
ncbi:MAG: universal stress protein [Treponema sp.]|jgi:nucleotide-binding universal stress UspA family protein|nr:universal stress protein [Treponema sp.]